MANALSSPTMLRRTMAHNASPARHTPQRVRGAAAASAATAAAAAAVASAGALLQANSTPMRSAAAAGLASPRTPLTRSMKRALQEQESLASCLSPDLDSLMLPQQDTMPADYSFESFRSPGTALKEEHMMFRSDRLFSPVTRSATKQLMTPMNMGMPASPLFPQFGSPSLGVLPMPPLNFGRSPHRDPLARPLLSDAVLMAGFSETGFDVFLGDSDPKRMRRDGKKEKKTPTSAAPKRGEYRCGKCGFFPKKQKHSCAPDKQKKAGGQAPKATVVAAAFPAELAALPALPPSAMYCP